MSGFVDDQQLFDAWRGLLLISILLLCAFACFLIDQNAERSFFRRRMRYAGYTRRY